MSKKKEKAAPPQPKQRSEARTAALRERAMIVRYSVSRWYGRGADEGVVSEVREQNKAEGDIGTFTKRLMTRDRLSPIDSIVNEARTYHKKVTLSWGEAGQRLLPADIFFEYKKEMTAFEMRFHGAVAEFCKEYPGYVEAETKRLGSLYSKSDYPSVDELRAHFRWELKIDPLPSAEDFRVDLGEEESKRIRDDIEQRVAEETGAAMKGLVARVAEMVEIIKDRMSNAESKKLRRAVFDNLGELVGVLPKLNVTRDPELDRLAKQIKKDLLDGLDIEAVRESEPMRKELASKAGNLMKALSTYAKVKQ